MSFYGSWDAWKDSHVSNPENPDSDSPLLKYLYILLSKNLNSPNRYGILKTTTIFSWLKRSLFTEQLETEKGEAHASF